MKCNLVVPGFAKSGTSSFHAYLDQHPQVCMSTIKEPHFFAKDSHFARGTAWHDGLFQGCEQQARWFGESSTLYSVWEPALERIATHLENPRLIVLLRHPVRRLLSHYRWMYTLGLEKKPLRAAIQYEQRDGYDPERHRRGNYPWYLRVSQYAYFGSLMCSIFGDERVLLLRSEDLAVDPQATLDRCFEFLDLEPVPITAEVALNKTDEKVVQVTFGLDRISRVVPRAMLDAIDPNHKVRESLKKLMGTRRLVAPPPSDSDLGWLEELLAEDIRFFKGVPRITSEVAN